MLLIYRLRVGVTVTKHALLEKFLKQYHFEGPSNFGVFEKKRNLIGK